MDLIDVTLGKRVQIHPTAIVAAGTTIGDDCIIDAYAVVGRLPRRGWTARDPGPPLPTVIGSGTLIGCHAVVYAGAFIGERCLIGDGVSIREGCVIGTGVRLSVGVSINYDTTIGAETVVMQNTHLTGRMLIGARCFIGPLVATMNHREPRYGFVDHEVLGPRIGDDVLIGGGACLLPGITIGDGAIIAAGAIVTKDVPAQALARGQAAAVVQR